MTENPLDELPFPEDFLWGTATSSHQVEGHNENNDWWEWEKEPGHIKDGSRSGAACDWWNRAEEDLKTAAEMGQNAHRLSVEWSRIEPQEGEWDEKAIARYRRLLEFMHQVGLKPMVTLHHFTNPRWLAARGGWETREVIPLFERYVTKVVESLGDLCDLWCTINEPNVYAYQSYGVAVWPPQKKSLLLLFRVLRNMVEAHAAAYHTIHRLQPEAQVGLAYNMHIIDPANPSSPLDRAVAWAQDYLFNRLFLKGVTEGRMCFPLGKGELIEKAADSVDFSGLNYYSRHLVTFDLRCAGEMFGRRFTAPGSETGPGTWGEFYPLGLYRLVRELVAYGKPIYITENGCPDNTDEQRPRFIITHLTALWKAIQEGAPVKGYFFWSLIDNFEWAEGWGMRFGLIALDEKTQERRMKRSGELYARICQAKALTREMVGEFAPELLDRWPDKLW